MGYFFICCGPPAWGLGKGLTTPHCEKPACYEMLHRALETGSYEGSIKGREFLN
jgi:hypothetical protein